MTMPRKQSQKITVATVGRPYVIQMDWVRAVRRMYEGVLLGTRPRQRWSDNVERDVTELGTPSNWMQMAHSRPKYYWC